MDQTPRVKGVVDIVFLLDVTGSMGPCIGAVKDGLNTFITSLTTGDANSESPIKDWRLKVVGYRDQAKDGTNWWVENPFVRDVAAAQAQLAAPNMAASGGGDEPESLLDALYKLSKMEQSGPDDAEAPDRWRFRQKAARVVAFFTDATFKTPLTLPEAVGGTVSDVHVAIAGSRIRLFGLAPEWEGYNELAAGDKMQFEYYATCKDTPALAGLGKDGDEGKAAMNAAVAALEVKAKDSYWFPKLMVILGKSITETNATDLA